MGYGTIQHFFANSLYITFVYFCFGDNLRSQKKQTQRAIPLQERIVTTVSCLVGPTRRGGMASGSTLR